MRVCVSACGPGSRTAAQSSDASDEKSILSHNISFDLNDSSIRKEGAGEEEGKSVSQANLFTGGNMSTLHCQKEAREKDEERAIH